MKSRAEAETERILLEQYDSLYRLAYSYVRSEHDALDVVQESAYKAYRDCRKVKNQEVIWSWICRIVINTSLDLLRRQGRELPLEEEWPVQAGPEEAAAICDRLELDQVLGRLGEKERAVIILRYFEDRKLEEIAGILGENVNTVKARLYRTLKKLRLELDGSKEAGA